MDCYYRHPGGNQKRADMPGVDARGDGGYVLAPPSRTVKDAALHQAAGVYRGLPETRDLPLADAPAWLVDGMAGRRSDGPGAAPGWPHTLAVTPLAASTLAGPAPGTPAAALVDVRCPRCKLLLGRVRGAFEIRCRRCGCTQAGTTTPAA